MPWETEEKEEERVLLYGGKFFLFYYSGQSFSCRICRGAGREVDDDDDERNSSMGEGESEEGY